MLKGPLFYGTNLIYCAATVLGNMASLLVENDGLNLSVDDKEFLDTLKHEDILNADFLRNKQK